MHGREVTGSAPSAEHQIYFMIQPTHEKQAFLRLVLKSAAWRHGELHIQFEEPFENLKRSNQLSRRKDSEEIEMGVRRQRVCKPLV
jgi:hypothetical protein